jgi:hypothetical protein
VSIESDISDAVDSLLDEWGSTGYYIRDNTTTTVTVRRSVGQSQTIELNGTLVEYIPVDFILLTTALPYLEPRRGDRIKYGSEVYEVSTPGGEKVFRQITSTMTRIHTQQVK